MRLFIHQSAETLLLELTIEGAKCHYARLFFLLFFKLMLTRCDTTVVMKASYNFDSTLLSFNFISISPEVRTEYLLLRRERETHTSTGSWPRDTLKAIHICLLFVVLFFFSPFLIASQLIAIICQVPNPLVLSLCLYSIESEFTILYLY